MLNKMMRLGGSTGKDEYIGDPYGGGDWGYPGGLGDDGTSGDPSYGDPFSNQGGYGSDGTTGDPSYEDPFGTGNGDPFAGATADVDGGGFGNFTNPFGNTNTNSNGFDLSSLFSGNSGALITAFLNQQNNSQTQDDIDEMIRAGIPYNQSNRDAASDRLTGLTNGTINASTDPAFMANLGNANENLMRQFNAHGMNLSGNEVGALGQQNLAAFSKYREDELAREMTRSGANMNPSSTANAGITAAAFMAAMRGNDMSALLAALGRKPDVSTTTINNNPAGGNNNPNGSNPYGNNTNNPNSPFQGINNQKPPGTPFNGNPYQTSPGYYGDTGGGGNASGWNGSGDNPYGSFSSDTGDPSYGDPFGTGYSGDVDYGDPFGGGDYGGDYGTQFDVSDWDDWGDWGSLGDW